MSGRARRAGPGLGRAAAYIAGALLLAVYPLLFRGSFYVNIASEILIFAIAAMSLDLLLGYAGLASLGHAAFFGIGAYTAGIIGAQLTPLLPATLVPAVVVAAVSAYLGGWLAIRAVGIYFIFLTLALAQTLYAMAFKWKWLTGGSDGLTDVPRPSLGPMDGLVDLNQATAFFWLIAVLFVACYGALHRIVRSPFGTVLVSIRENAERASTLGYDVLHHKLVAFVVSGGFAGLAGALYSYLNRLVAPDQLAWQTSATLVLMVVLGGSATLIGPVIGAALILVLQNVVSSYTARWPMLMGAAFVLVVLFARRGIAGTISRVLPR